MPSDPLNQPVEVRTDYEDGYLLVDVRPADVLAALTDEQIAALAVALWGHYSHDEADEGAEIAAMRAAVVGVVRDA